MNVKQIEKVEGMTVDPTSKVFRYSLRLSCGHVVEATLQTQNWIPGPGAVYSCQTCALLDRASRPRTLLEYS